MARKLPANDNAKNRFNDTEINVLAGFKASKISDAHIYSAHSIVCSRVVKNKNIA